MLAAGVKMGQAQAQAQAQQQAQHAAEVEQARQEGAKTAAPAAAKDITAELQKLAELHKSGVLSAEEFAAAKKKILG
ncbi:MAG: SHOCT domain-containing protein [Methanomicrobiales archaeon]|nr:SHOCT domain-containing protein [Methanomicrobiales archaeon]